MLIDAEWLPSDGEGKPIRLTTVEKILIPAKDVEIVEFIKSELEYEETLQGLANETPS